MVLLSASTARALSLPPKALTSQADIMMPENAPTLIKPA